MRVKDAEEFMSNIFLGSIFLSGAFFDLKKKALPIWFLGGSLLASIIVFLICRPVSWTIMAAGIVPGLIFLLLSHLTKEAIGYGDGIFMVTAGIQLGGEKLLGILLVALLISAVFSLILLVFRRAGRKTAIPFIPFLAAGFFISLFGQ